MLDSEFFHKSFFGGISGISDYLILHNKLGDVD
jgi:hypothetical protein